MRTVKFARIDFLQLYSIRFFFLLPLLFAFLARREGEYLFPLYYSLFMSIIASSLPYEAEAKVQNGFTQMLPSRGPERIWGHYLYGFLVQALFLALGHLCLLIPHIQRGTPLPGLWGPGGTLLYSGLSLVVIAVENLIWTLFRFQGTVPMAIVRLLPPFLFFFGLLSLEDENEGALLQIGEALHGASALLPFLLCLLFYIAMALLAGFLSVRKGQA